jgi:acyl-CoA synthetase (AMP-forming)/AMP-acid ligase II
MGEAPLALGQILDAAAARAADTPAIVFKETRVSYAEVAGRADAFARGLLALGLRPGDHVVLWMPNSIEWNVVNFAIAKIGGVTVTCNSRYKAIELEYLLRQSDATALVMMDRFEVAGIDYREILRGVVPDVLWQQDRRIVSAKFPELQHVIVFGAEHDPGCLAAEAVVRRGATVPPTALGAIRVPPESPAAMLYTSGTTGAPKGCLLSHGNFWYKASEYLRLHEWTADDRCLVAVPYFHIFGALGCVAANTLAASTQVLMEVFDPEEAMRLIERERVTILSGVPTMFITMLGHPRFREFDLRSLRTGTIGAAPVPVEMMRKILDREHGLGMDATVVYGLTEATGGTHFTRLGGSARQARRHRRARHVRAGGPSRGPVDGPRVRRRQGGRGLCQGTEPHARLLQGPRGDGPENPRRLASHRRHGRQGRAGVPPDHRPAQRHDHRRRLQHVSRRDRELLFAASEDTRRLDRRRARPGAGRGRHGLRDSQGRRDAHAAGGA